MRASWLVGVLVGAMSVGALAQDEAAEVPAEAPAPVEGAEADEPGPEKPERMKVRDPLLVAITLPQAAQAARASGIAEEEVREALRAQREAGVDAVAATESMRRSAKAAREHGTIENFGDFVKDQLASGKRGKDLSEAIRAEHEARGKGGKGKGPGGPGGEHGKPEGAGEGMGGEHGKPDGAGEGMGGEHGKPEGAGEGRPEGAGAKGGKGKKGGKAVPGDE